MWRERCWMVGWQEEKEEGRKTWCLYIPAVLIWGRQLQQKTMPGQNNFPLPVCSQIGDTAATDHFSIFYFYFILLIFFKLPSLQLTDNDCYLPIAPQHRWAAWPHGCIHSTQACVALTEDTSLLTVHKHRIRTTQPTHVHSPSVHCPTCSPLHRYTFSLITITLILSVLNFWSACSSRVWLALVGHTTSLISSTASWSLHTSQSYHHYKVIHGGVKNKKEHGRSAVHCRHLRSFPLPMPQST